MEINILSWTIGTPEIDASIYSLNSSKSNSTSLSENSDFTDNYPPPELDEETATDTKSLTPKPEELSCNTPVKRALSALKDLGIYRPHILCFQENSGNKINRKIKDAASDAWKFHTEQPFMIGYDTKRFEEVSVNKQKTHLCLDLKDRETKKIIRVATAAIPSINLEERIDHIAHDTALVLDRTLEAGDEAPELCLAGIDVNRNVNEGQIEELKEWNYHVITEKCGGGYRDVQAIVAKSNHDREVTILGHPLGMLIPFDNSILNPTQYSPILATVTCKHSHSIMRKTYDAAISCVIQ